MKTGKKLPLVLAFFLSFATFFISKPSSVSASDGSITLAAGNILTVDNTLTDADITSAQAQDPSCHIARYDLQAGVTADDGSNTSGGGPILSISEKHRIQQISVDDFLNSVGAQHVTEVNTTLAFYNSDLSCEIDVTLANISFSQLPYSY